MKGITLIGLGLTLACCSREPASGSELHGIPYTPYLVDSGKDARSDLTTFVCGNPVLARGDVPMIDDFERGDWPTNDAGTENADGRTVEWYAYSPSGWALAYPLRSVIVGGRGTSQAALHLSPSRTDAPDAGWSLAVSLTGAPVSPEQPMPRDECYDASAYLGLTFWYRSTVDLSVGVLTPGVVPVNMGGECVKNCWIPPATLIPSDDDWRLATLPWAAFGPFDLNRVNGFRFWSGNSDLPEVDLWLDDVGFIGASSPQDGGAAGAGGTSGAGGSMHDAGSDPSTGGLGG